MQYAIAICSIAFSMLVIYQQDSLIENAYRSGFDAGVQSIVPEDKDKMCLKWMFESNMKTVKKRICGK
jgi:hypothetical protein